MYILKWIDFRLRYKRILLDKFYNSRFYTGSLVYKKYIKQQHLPPPLSLSQNTYILRYIYF